jgi:hypothetical protein
MTGGGTSNAAYLHEPAGDYMGSPSDTTYKVPGKNLRIDDISIENALQRMNQLGSSEAREYIEGNFEGAFAVSFVQTMPWYHNHVFGEAPSAGGEGSAPYSYTWTPTTGRVQSSRWYVGVDYLDATAERELKGVVFPQLSVTCRQGEPVEVSLTGFYGDEALGTSLTPGSKTGPGKTPLIFHGGSLSIPSSSTMAKMDEATLEVNTNARPQRDWSRHPVDAVIGNVETTLDMSKTSTGTSNLELAYGSSGSTSPQQSVGSSDGSLKFTTPGATLMEYQLAGVRADSYNWQNVGAPDEEDVLEDVTWRIDNVTAYAESSESSAL